MGNVAFVLPRLQPVADKGLIPLAAEGVAGEALRIVLSDAKTPIKADAKVRESVLALYKDSKFRPMWTSNGTVSERAKTVLATLKNAAQDGLEPGRYLPAGFTSFDDIDGQIAGSNIAAAQFDVALTVAIATYAVHLSGGAFEPGKLSLYHDVQPEGVTPATALKVLAYTPYPPNISRRWSPNTRPMPCSRRNWPRFLPRAWKSPLPSPRASV
jgi:murein L,D-transpeptidase YcbB/YkuD